MLLLIQNKNLLNIDYHKKFTIHFATINTKVLFSKKTTNPEFTIHFATINTNVFGTIVETDEKFTIHFATINTEETTEAEIVEYDLQYTLLLLILFLRMELNIDDKIYNTLCYY